MPTTYGANFHGKSLKVKLSLERGKDMGGAEEDYHAQVSVSVPFMWESQPGTPKKVQCHDNGGLLSPLTPPPSYFSPPSPRPLGTNGKSPRTNFLNSIFRKLPASKSSLPQSPASTCSSCSSSDSNSPRPFHSSTKTTSSVLMKVRKDDEEAEDEDEVDSPVSTLFFGGGASQGPTGCYPKFAKVFSRDFK